MNQAEQIADLHEALKEAADLVRRTGSNAHVYGGREGFVTSTFRPGGEEREQWLRVRSDGKIEDGRTRRKVGTLKELGL